MAGRTAWEILMGKNKPKDVEFRFVNPLELRIGGNVTVNTIDFGRHMFNVEQIWAWDRNINGKTFPLTDYFLRSSEASVLIRVLPRDNPNADIKHHVLVMKQYYPENTDQPLGWCDESPAILEAANSDSGDFIRFAGTENEIKYWRVGGNIPIPCEVNIIRDLNGDKKIDETEVEKVPYTLWDFHRETLDEAQQKMTEFLYIQLSGSFSPPNKVRGGDKTIVIYRGEEIPPDRIMAY